MEKNNCYKCPYRKEAPGSAHSECHHPVMNAEQRLLMAMSIASGRVPEWKIKETGEVLLGFDSHGVKNGWCNWPLNFDPVWVTCKLPIDETT